MGTAAAGYTFQSLCLLAVLAADQTVRPVSEAMAVMGALVLAAAVVAQA